MQRREFLLGLAAGAAGLAAMKSRLVKASDPPPNIVLLLSDDWGWPFYGFMRDPRVLPACELANLPVPRTPTLDRLVSEGICFHQGSNTAAKCQHSRESIYTGLNRRDLVKAHFATFAKAGIATMPVELAKHGYRTLGLGKWEVSRGGLLGSFTENRTYSPGGQRFYSKAGATRGNLTIVDRFFSDRRDDGRPWFLSFAPILPHQPYYRPLEPAYSYDGVSRDGVVDTCGLRFTVSPIAFREFLGSCTWFDELAGQIVEDKLHEYGFESNTLILYLTDNGAILHGSKGNFRENGLRTPIVAHFPGRIPPTGLHSALVGAIDLFPTMLDYAGVDPESWPNFPDARSFRALAEDPSPENVAAFRSLFFSNWLVDGARAVRDATYKIYTDNKGTEQKFFNLAVDPFEQHDLLSGALSSEEDRVRCSLKNALNDWWCSDPPLRGTCQDQAEVCSEPTPTPTPEPTSTPEPTPTPEP